MIKHAALNSLISSYIVLLLAIAVNRAVKYIRGYINART